MDIKNFCTAYLHGKASNIKVGKGVGISPMPDQGLIPVVNVIITPADSSMIMPDEWERIKVELVAELGNQSAVDMNYEISVEGVS